LKRCQRVTDHAALQARDQGKGLPEGHW